MACFDRFIQCWLVYRHCGNAAPHISLDYIQYDEFFFLCTCILSTGLLSLQNKGHVYELVDASLGNAQPTSQISSDGDWAVPSVAGGINQQLGIHSSEVWTAYFVYSGTASSI